jgi:hypothetical protein
MKSAKKKAHHHVHKKKESGEAHEGHSHDFATREEWAVHMITEKWRSYRDKSLRILKLRKRKHLKLDV